MLAKKPAKEFVPTVEQAEIMDTFKNTTKNIAILAYAGAGKTTTLKALADANPNMMFFYTAFNTDIVADVKKKMPSNVECKTIHGMAAQYFAKDHYGPHWFGRIGTHKTAYLIQKFKLSGTQVAEKTGAVHLTANNVAHVLKGTLNKFQNSDIATIKDTPVSDADGFVYKNPEFCAFIRKNVQLLWDDMTNPNTDEKINHNTYLKAWSLSTKKVFIPFDAVMVDEAQDVNPVMLAAVINQMGTKRLIFVGDENQMIYGWNGCINAMEKIQNAEVRRLTRTYRFGNNILNPANQLLKLLNPKNPDLLGLPTDGAIFNPNKPYTVLCRTNAMVVSEALSAAQMGKKVAINKGFAGIYNSLMYLHYLLKYRTYAAACDNLTRDGYAKVIGSNDYSMYYSEAEVMADTDSKVIAREVRFARGSDTPAILNQISDATGRLSSKTDILISTAHKAKGLEWDQVRLAADFEFEGPDEWRLVYVAATRAKQALEASQLLQYLADKKLVS